MKVTIKEALKIEKNMTTEDISEKWNDAKKEVKDLIIAQGNAFIEPTLETIKQLEDGVKQAIQTYNEAKKALEIAKAALGIADIPTIIIAEAAKAKNEAIKELIIKVEGIYVDVPDDMYNQLNGIS